MSATATQSNAMVATGKASPATPSRAPAFIPCAPAPAQGTLLLLAGQNVEVVGERMSVGAAVEPAVKVAQRRCEPAPGAHDQAVEPAAHGVRRVHRKNQLPIVGTEGEQRRGGPGAHPQADAVEVGEETREPVL